MHAKLVLIGASRLTASGPRSHHWQIEFLAKLAGGEEYRGIVGIGPLGGSADASRASKTLPNDLPDFLPSEILEERVHWYVLQQLMPALLEQIEPVIKLGDEVTEQFEVIDASWEYLGVV